MADSSNGNTTSLNMSVPGYTGGTIGTRQFNDATTRGISSSISRKNFNVTVQSDARMQEFRDAVYKLVSSWMMEDKIAIISEYGDAGFLKKYKNPPEEVVNKVCTESIIIHMDPKDLKQLYSDIMIKEKQLNSKVKMISAKNQRNAKNSKNKSFFNTQTFENAYNSVKYMDSSEEFKKGVASYDPSYKVPAVVAGQFGTLRKELNSVLKDCFNKNELAAIANSMGINVPEGTKGNEINKWIINKVCLYVSLMTGNGKKNYANAISNVEPYNNLLKYTSYSYITGEPGLDPSAWAELKRQARLAKMAIKERAKMQKTGKFKGTSNDMRAVTGGKTAKTKTGMARLLRKSDTGVLQDATYEELVTLAGKYGIDASKFRNKNIGYLKAQIYNGMAQENKRINKLQGKTNKAESHGWVNTKARDLLAIHNDGRGSAAANTVTNGVPLIHLDKGGSVVESLISSAVPVYIVGQGRGGKREGYVQDDEFDAKLKQKNKNTYKMLNANVKSRSDLDDSDISILEMFMSLPAIDPTAVNVTKTKKFKSLADVKYFLSNEGLSSETTGDIDAQAQDISFKRILYCWAYAYVIGASKLFTFLTKKYKINIKIKVSKGKKLLNKTILRDRFQLAQKIENKINARKAKKNGVSTNSEGDDNISGDNKPLSAADVLSNDAYNPPPIPKMVWEDSKTKYNPPEVVPVYVVGTFSDRYEKGMGANIDAAGDYKKKNNLEKEDGKGRITLTRDAATIVAEMEALGYSPTSKILKNKKGKANTSYPLTTKDLKWATENGFKFATGGSSFIVGDSLTNRPNPEMVTVKGDGSYTVNPIKKGPENGYSDYALHAAGGQGKAGKKSITGITGKIDNLQSYNISDTASSIGIKKIFKGAAIPAYLVNGDITKAINSASDNIAGVISDNFASLKLGLSNYVITAPMGVGAMTSPTLLASGIKDKALNVALDVMDSAASAAKSAFTAASGGVVRSTLRRTPKFATGGTNSVITGDAAGKNIFANGAKPELVSSNGDISITPLNKTGSESRSKITRMTQAERNSALATAISSHVVKFSYKLPDGLEEVSNTGEAIKVYDVKPGLNDEISVGGATTTVADMLAGILTALTSITANSTTGNQLLTAIAAKSSGSSSGSTGSSGNPFAGGFTSSLDGILGGN